MDWTYLPSQNFFLMWIYDAFEVKLATIQPTKSCWYLIRYIFVLGSPIGSDGKESACNERDPDLIPGLGKSSGEGIGNPLQYSCLENSTDRGAWRATVRGVTKIQPQLSN